MWLGPDSRGQQPLISEAVRGEGAFLVDWEGDRFMQGVHELADLAPRDVVAKAITRRMHRDRASAHVARRPPPRRGVLGAPLPDDPGHLPRARRRPGHRADPGRARPATTPPAASRPTCGAARPCPGSTPPARSPARACTAPTGSPPTRCSRAWSSRAGSPRCCPASCRPWRDPAADRRPAGLVDAGVRRAAAGGDDRAGRRAAHARTAWPPRPSGSTSSLATPAGVVGQDAWETTNLVTISAAARRGRAAARGDPRLALARGLPRPRRRALVRAPRLVDRRRRADRRVPARLRHRAGTRRGAGVTSARRRSRRCSTSCRGAGLDPERGLRRHRRAPSRRTCPAARST